MNVLMEWAATFHYCEVTSSGFIAQPINTASNVIFIMIGLWSVMKLPKSLASWSIFFIALGSTYWHATLHPYGLVADIFTIVIWFGFFLYALCRQQQWRNWWLWYLMCVGLWAVSSKLHWIPMHSGAFVFSIVTLFLFAIRMRQINQQYFLFVLLSALFLTIAVVARVIDLMVCDVMPIGTHWLWHIFAGLSICPMMYLLFHKE